jgi:hypothetical protein
MKLIKLKNSDQYVRVDDADFEFLSKFNWNLGTTGYAEAHVLMHRLIADPGRGKIVDHADADRLNNQRQNLRPCTYQENGYNVTRRKAEGFKGVRLDTSCKKQRWTSTITANRKLTHLGNFDTPELAALMYDFWATFLHGEFANTNFKVVAHS